jgi:hypothetical protein
MGIFMKEWWNKIKEKVKEHTFKVEADIIVGYLSMTWRAKLELKLFSINGHSRVDF